MGLDIRVPIGLLFTILGGLLAVYGLLTLSGDMYGRSLGFNVNLWWGLVLLVFGVLMFLAGRRKPPGRAADVNPPAAPPPPA